MKYATPLIAVPSNPVVLWIVKVVFPVLSLMVALPLPVMVTTPPSMVAAAGSVPVLIVATLVVRFTLIVPVEE